MKGDGGDVRGAGIQGFVCEGRTPFLDVFTGELEGVHDGAQDGGGFGVGSTEPGFH
jgi:hypothetical protein